MSRKRIATRLKRGQRLRLTGNITVTVGEFKRNGEVNIVVRMPQSVMVTLDTRTTTNEVPRV